MKELSELFDLFKQITITLGGLNALERFAELEPDKITLVEPDCLIIDYFWYFPDGNVCSCIRINWYREGPLINIYGDTLTDLKISFQLAYLPEDFSCLYIDNEGRKWPICPDMFWIFLSSFIIDPEGSTSQKTGF